MLQRLNKEQKELLDGYAEKWVNKVYSQKSIDKPAFEKGVKWLYNDIVKLDSPTIVYCNSVEDACFRAASAYNKTENPTAEQISEARSQCSYYSSLPLSSHWVANYQYYHDIGVIDLENFKKFRDYILSGVFTAIEFEKAVFVVVPPVKYVRNQQGLLHNTEGLSIEFSDGTGYYHLQGRPIPRQYFTAVKEKTLTVEQFLKIENEEHKSACILAMQEMYDDSYVADFFREFLQEVDTFVDEKAPEYLKGTTKDRGEGMNVGVYTLFKGKINQEPIAYVRCYCPSTDRMFFLGCEPEFTSSKDAIASLYRVPVELRNHIKYIQRQGEVFSTVFTEDGMKILKTLSQEQLRDTTTITGDEYFTLMRYEY